MRKWAFIFVAATVGLVGCGGTGGSGPTPKKTGGNNGSTAITVNLTNLGTEPPGAIEVAFLTGQGRAPGDLIAVVSNLVFNDNYGEVTNPLAPQTACPLVGFQNNIVRLDAPFSPGIPSRQFTTFNLNFLEFEQETSSPGVVNIFQPPTTQAEGGPFPIPYPANFRVFPGRVTSLPIYIDDSMFTVDTTVVPPLIDFDNGQGAAPGSQFNLSNGNVIKGFLSDFVSFNTNSLPPADKAAIGAAAGFGGTPADRIFFSGDVYAVTNGHTSGANIAALTLNPSLQVNGNLGSSGKLNGPNGTLPHAGTYSLLALNPTDITQTMTIVATQGIWREDYTVLSGLSSTKLNVVTFPDSNDDNMQEMVAFTQDASNNIKTLYFGFVDLDALTFNLYPAINLVSGSTVDGSGNPNGVSGTLGTLFTQSGGATSSPDLVRSGTYTVTNVPAGAAYPQPPSVMAKGSTGTFYVFRI